QRPDIYIGGALSEEPGGPPSLYIKGPAPQFVLDLVAAADVRIIIVDEQPYSFEELVVRSGRVHQALVDAGYLRVATGTNITGGGIIPASVLQGPGLPTEPAEVLAFVPEELRSDVDLQLIAAPPRPSTEPGTWGPLAVLDQPGGFGPGVGLGPITLRIGEACVWIESRQGRHATTLVWEGDQVDWRPKNRRIVFTDRKGNSLRLFDGDRIEGGGLSLWPPEVSDGQERTRSTPEPGRRWAASLDKAWLQEPDPSCPEALFYLDEVTVKKRSHAPGAQAVTPDGRGRGRGWTLAAAEKIVGARDDYAGAYLDRKRHGLPVLLFTGDLDSAIEQLRGRFGDDVNFEVRKVERSLADLKATQQAITERLDDLAAAGLDIREVGTSVSANRVEVGAYAGLTAVREALAEYGDMVHVFWSEGGFTGPEPVRGTAVKRVDDVKLRLTLDDYPLVAGKPTWITTKVKNVGDTAITYWTDSCENAVGVRGELVGERWRPGQPADVEAIRDAGRSQYDDLRWRSQEWNTAGIETIGLGFAAKGVPNADEWVCADIAIPHRVPPGGVVEQRLRWDGQALGRLGPPPDGVARITGSFDFRRPGTKGRQNIEVQLDVPVTEGRDPELLHPMEAVDAALADDAFRALIEPVRIGNASEEVVLYDDERGVWVVGACGRFEKQWGYWKAAVVDAATGEVKRILDRPTGEYCFEGPWKR
ncbi:MAG: hypothetical protein ACC726_08355, partial [Chloroflexota bacterium]